MRCEEAREGLGLLVLGALPAGEAAELEGHLADCGECRHERRRLAEVVDMLPWAVPEVQPAAAVELRLRTRTAPAARVVSTRSSSARIWRWVPVAATVLLLLNAGLAATTGLLYLRERATLAELRSGQREATLDRLAVAALAGGSGRALALHATGAGGAYGVFRMDASSGQVVLVAHGLPPTPPGHVYQGWMHRGPERISIGVFAPQGHEGVVVLTLSGQPEALLAQVDGFGVTLEPVGGSPAPTGPPVLVS